MVVGEVAVLNLHRCEIDHAKRIHCSLMKNWRAVEWKAATSSRLLLTILTLY